MPATRGKRQRLLGATGKEETDHAPRRAGAVRVSTPKQTGATRLYGPWLLVALPVLLSLLALPGCGGGALSFDGGGFPIGGTRMAGRIITSEAPTTPIANAKIMITSSDGSDHAPQIQQLVTGADGSFVFPKVGLGKLSGTVQVTVEPDANSNRRGQQIVFVLQNKVPAELTVALPPSNYDLSQGKNLEFVTPRQTLPPFDSVPLEAKILRADGIPLSLQPTVLIIGNIGTLSAGGLFNGTQVGTGTVMAFWYNNLVQSEQITVSDMSPTLPPPPPPKIDPTPSPPVTDSTGTKPQGQIDNQPIIEPR